MRAKSLPISASVIAVVNGFSAAPTGGYPMPPKGAYIDVTKAPFNAKGDGETDDTKAILKAFQASVKHRGKLLVYFPNGTYLVSGVDTSYRNDLLHGTLTFAGRKGATVVVGESRENTVIKLADMAHASPRASNPTPCSSWAAPGPAISGTASTT